MKSRIFTVLITVGLFAWLAGAQALVAGGDKQCELSKKWNDGKKCDQGKCNPDDSAKCEDMAKQCEECAAKGRKEAALKAEMADKASGEEAEIYRAIAKNFSAGADEKEKMAACVRNKDTEGFKKCQEACEKLMKDNGRLWERLKAIKQAKEGGSKEKSKTTASKASKGQGDSGVIENESDMAQWLGSDGSSQKSK